MIVVSTLGSPKMNPYDPGHVLERGGEGTLTVIMASETIRISYFARLRELTGQTGETLEISQATSVSSLYQTLQDKYGGLLDAQWIAFCVNDAYVPPDHVVRPGDHVVFIPPVAGG